VVGGAGTAEAAVRPAHRVVLLAVVAIGVLGLLAASGLGNSLVYYRTPSELAAQPGGSAQRVRLGGLVARGSVRQEGQSVRFVLTDGAADVTVLHRGDPGGVFQEGQGALVEGTYAADGVFRSDVLMVKHDNTYQPPSEVARRSAERGPIPEGSV